MAPKVQLSEAAKQQRREQREELRAAAKARKIQQETEEAQQRQANLRADADQARQQERALATMPAGRPGWKGAIAYHSIIGNVGDAVGTARMPARFTIEAADFEGRRLSKGGDPFLVWVRGPARTHARVSDLENGRYSVDFTPSTSGQYEISVVIFGVHLPGSPFAFHVFDPHPTAKHCVLQGDALKMARAREPQTFDVGFRDQLSQLAPAVELEVYVEPIEHEEFSPRAASRSPSPPRSHSPEPNSPPAAHQTPDKPSTSRGVRPMTAPGAQQLAEDPMGFTPPAARRKLERAASADRNNRGNRRSTPAMAASTVIPTKVIVSRTTVPSPTVIASKSVSRQPTMVVTATPHIGPTTIHRPEVQVSSTGAPAAVEAVAGAPASLELAPSNGLSMGPASRQTSTKKTTMVFATPAASRPTTVMATLASPPALSMQMHQQHMELWLRRETTDKLHNKGSFKVNRHDPRPYLAELDADPTGFAFGGVFPGTLHAHGRVVDLHQVRYSIGRAGTYHLHVNMRRDGTPLPGSPFKLTVLPGTMASAGTSFLILVQGDRAPARVVRGISGMKPQDDERPPSGCKFMLQSCDQVGNYCINGGATVTCECPLAPQLLQTCTDEGNGEYSIFFQAPARLEVSSYEVEVKIDNTHVLNSPIRMILDGSPEEEGALIPDHLWLGISLEGMRLFLKEIGINGVHRRGATGYDTLKALRTWLRRVGQEGYSICEVLSRNSRFRGHIGRANAYYSHRHNRSIWRALDCIQASEAEYMAGYPFRSDDMSKHEEAEPKSEESDDDEEEAVAAGDPPPLFFWMDYFVVRQCDPTFELPTLAVLIKQIGFTVVELDADPLDYLGSAWCLFELHASITARARICYNIDCVRAMQLLVKLKEVVDEKSVRVGLAKHAVDFSSARCVQEEDRKKIVAYFMPAKEVKVAEAAERYKELNELVIAKVKEGLAHLSQRQTLNVSSIDLSQRCISHEQSGLLAGVITGNTMLEMLNLSGSGLNDEGLAKVVHSIAMSTVQVVNLAKSGIGVLKSGILAEILGGSGKQLRSLNIDGNDLRDEGAAAFATKLRTVESNLTSLSLKENHIQAEGLAKLAAAIQEDLSIVELFLDDNIIGESYHSTNWNPVVMPGGLVRLVFEHENSPSVDGMAALADALSRNQTLTKLSIVGNQISDDGYAVLANALLSSHQCQLAYLLCDKFCIEESTTVLELPKGNPMTEAEMALLAGVLSKNSTVTSLSIAGTSTGDAAHRTLGGALQQSAVSKLAYLACDKWSLTGGESPTNSLALESRQFSMADMILLGSVLARNRAVTNLAVDGFRLSSRQLAGDEAVDRRAPLACHIIVSLARGMPMEALREPAYANLDDNGEGRVERASFLTEVLVSSGTAFSRITSIWDALDKDDTGHLTLQSFARGVRQHSELALAAVLMQQQRDPVMDFLVFRWKHAEVPSDLLNVPHEATGKLKVQGLPVGTLVPCPFVRKDGTLSPLSERVRFIHPTSWLRAVDYLSTPQPTVFKHATADQHETRQPDGIFSCNGQPNATFQVQCTLSTGSEFSFTVCVREWTFDLTGIRLRTLGQPGERTSPSGMTVIRHTPSNGVVTCLMDNSDETRALTLRCPIGALSVCAEWLRPRAAQEPRYVIAQAAASPAKVHVHVELDGCRHKYLPGQLLLVLHQGGWLLEATVLVGPGRLRPTRHVLHVPHTGEVGTFDLHSFNHCRRRFETRHEFREGHQALREAYYRSAVANAETQFAWQRAAFSMRGLQEQLNCLSRTASRSYPEAEVELLLHERWAHDE